MSTRDLRRFRRLHPGGVLSRACYDPRMSVTELLRSAAEALAGVDLLVVFGSAARGTDRPRSDVDVGVRLRDDSPAARRAVELALGRSVHREVDVVYLDEPRRSCDSRSRAMAC
jgi:predicted nucleotidyltransferase